MKSLKKIMSLMLLVVIITAVITPLTASPVAANVKNLQTDIYNDSSDNILAKKIEGIVKIVAGVGGVAFVLAILIISLFIIFGSISANQVGTWWKALFSCMAGAFIFFSAYAFAPAIAKLAFAP